MATHGVFFALGAYAGLLLLRSLAGRAHLPTAELPWQVLHIFAGGLLAARLGYVLLYLDRFDSVGQIFAIWQGGLVSYFGIAGGLLVAVLVFKEKRLLWLDLVALATLLSWAVGRLGNYYAADVVGVEHQAFAAFYGRVPISLFESLLCLVLLGVLLRWRPRRPGYTFGLALLGYMLGRSLIDIWRDEYLVLPYLHISQLISLVVAIGTLIWLRTLPRWSSHER